LTFSDLSNLLSLAIDHLSEANVILINLCCDNAASNTAALNHLGAAVSDSERLKVTIDRINLIGEPIFVILDTSHLIKLARNTLGDLQLLFTADGRRIEWRFITELEKLQSSEQLHLANKITKEHIQFQKKKMRVYLATQVLSASVADAIEFCDKDLGLQQFANSGATCEYVRICNTAFDLLDSKVPFTKNTKMPLRKDNKPVWTAHFNAIEHFVCGLLHTDPTAAAETEQPVAKKPKKDQRVVSGPRKKGFLGFLVNMRSYRAIFKIYVEEKEFLSYLLGHKFSQDHLEMMFGTIRSSLGLNNNPTVIQEGSFVKKLL
jgi:hypothetical protein